METPKETKPATVPQRDKQAGETSATPIRVAGAEPEVWTERMQTALVRGVKGNLWFSLIDKVYADRTLELAWEKVESNAGGSGVDNITVGLVRVPGANETSNEATASNEVTAPGEAAAEQPPPALAGTPSASTAGQQPTSDPNLAGSATTEGENDGAVHG